MQVDGVGSGRCERAWLREAARQALADFGIEDPTVRLLRHEHNTTFRVSSPSGTFMLRINRSGVHGAATIASELAWLEALVRDTGLGVPEPVATLDGSPLVVVPAQFPGGSPRPAVLLRWQEGHLVDARLAPRHLRQVAIVQAALHQHATGWDRPDGFVRPRVDTLTTTAKTDSIASWPAAADPYPLRDDAESAIGVVDDLLSAADAAVVARAVDIVWETTATLQAAAGLQGLIHGDLHYENILFHRGVARAIDFDDCGWGFYLYDLVVTLWELEDRERYPELRDALLDEYSRHLPLPADLDHHLKALTVLRRLQILMWFLESRDHLAFRADWRRWADDEIQSITAAVRSFG